MALAESTSVQLSRRGLKFSRYLSKLLQNILLQVVLLASGGSALQTAIQRPLANEQDSESQELYTLHGVLTSSLKAAERLVVAGSKSSACMQDQAALSSSIAL